MKLKSIIIGQSGGPTTVINASLQGIIEAALSNPNIEHIYGALNGIEGILNKNIIDFRNEDLDNIQLLKNTPSSILGSVRFKLNDYTIDENVYKEIVCVLKDYNIGYFFYIGGNDSMDTCNKINEYFKYINFDCKVVGVPKTIDNDLVLTDHAPGYGSSIKYIATTTAEIYQDTSAYTTGRVTIVEIMGRDAGWLAAGSKLASLVNCGPDLIYLPEVAFDIENFLLRVNQIYNKKKRVLVAVSEGITDKDGEYILKHRLFNNEDNFGHLQLGGVGQVLAQIVNTRLDLPIRSVELNLPQRCASHIASLTDLKEAYLCGYNALKMALNGNTGIMVAMKRIDNYNIDYVPVKLVDVANFVKKVPLEYIDTINANIHDSFIEYALPLIQGEPTIRYENGFPKFAKLNKIIIKK